MSSVADFRVETTIPSSLCLRKVSQPHTSVPAEVSLIRSLWTQPQLHLPYITWAVVDNKWCHAYLTAFMGMIYNILKYTTISSNSSHSNNIGFVLFYCVSLAVSCGHFVSSFSFRILHFNFSARSKYLLDLCFQTWHFGNLLFWFLPSLKMPFHCSCTWIIFVRYAVLGSQLFSLQCFIICWNWRVSRGSLIVSMRTFCLEKETSTYLNRDHFH